MEEQLRSVQISLNQTETRLKALEVVKDGLEKANQTLNDDLRLSQQTNQKLGEQVEQLEVHLHNQPDPSEILNRFDTGKSASHLRPSIANGRPKTSSVNIYQKFGDH